MKQIFLACTAVLALGAALSVTPAAAQETTNSGSIGGRVTDPSGAVVPGAQVTARQTDTNLTRTATTDAEGRFRFPYLKVGRYEITVQREGFAQRHALADRDRGVGL